MGGDVRLAIAGGVPLIRRGICLQLRGCGVTVVGEYPELSAIGPGHDAVILLGMRAEGVSTVPEVLAVAAAGTAVLVLTDTPARWRAARTTVRAASRGRAPRVEILPLGSSLEDLLSWLAEVGARATPAARPLTETEQDVYDLLALGLSNAGIAARLSLSPRTVECHVTHLFGKLGLSRSDPRYNPRVAAALHWSQTRR